MKPTLEYPSITGPLMANSHPGSYSGQDAYSDMFPVILNSSGGGYNSITHRNILQRRRYTQRRGTGIYRDPEQRLRERKQKMSQRKYRVRRLTPLECARLQGLPDGWGTPDSKEHMTDEEVDFWNRVRQTLAAMDGKTVRQMTEPQAVKWYNALQTDSAEYRMYGNGIALPNASFVLRRIASALRGDPL